MRSEPCFQETFLEWSEIGKVRGLTRPPCLKMWLRVQQMGVEHCQPMTESVGFAIHSTSSWIIKFGIVL